MENEINNESGITYSTRQKIWFEIKDFLAGIAFPLIAATIFSSTIIMFASYEGDYGVRLGALLGGEALLIISYIIFGKANGSAAYGKTIQNATKRQLGSTERQVVYRTGEYALWKGFFVGFLSTVPFLLVLIIQLCVDNVFTSFSLKYIFAWGYYPFAMLGEQYLALDLLMVIVPTCMHAIGYHIGKLNRIKEQEEIEKTGESAKKRKRK